ncbi:MAG: sirohydrochlorin chelatase [Jatrophihabitantaceae bacterium]
MPHLLIAAHGTDSSVGSATTSAVVAGVRAARPELDVSACFLDVAAPSLGDALETLDGPVVIVPLLLSSGYHVRTDIPAIAAGHPDVRVAQHIGPDPALADLLATRLAAVRGSLAITSTALVSIGSSRATARAEVDKMARLLAERVGRPVAVLPLFGDVRSALTALPGPVEIAPYLLADGHFLTALRAAADGLGPVADPIGADPVLVALILARFDAVR